MEFRKVEKYHMDSGIWTLAKFEGLIVGDMFRVFENDGVKLMENLEGGTVFIATSIPEKCKPDGNWKILCDAGNIVKKRSIRRHHGKINQVVMIVWKLKGKEIITFGNLVKNDNDEVKIQHHITGGRIYGKDVIHTIPKCSINEIVCLDINHVRKVPIIE